MYHREAMVTAAISASGGARAPWVSRLGISAAIGLLLALLGLCVFPTPSVRLEGSQFQLREGSGKTVGAALEVAAASANGQVVAVSGVPELPAYRYRSVRFRATGLESSIQPAVFWIAGSAPRDAHARPLSAAEIQAGEAVLSSDDRWRGDIISFGVVTQGRLASPLRLEMVELLPAPLAWDETLALLVRNWTHLDSWSGGSVNFYVGALRSERRLTPVVMMAAWASLTLVVFALGQAVSRGRLTTRDWAPAAAATLLAGMFLLDLRWQADAAFRATRTLGSAEDVPDSSARRALEGFRALITEPRARVLVVTDDAGSYATQRARYHILPLRASYGMTRLPMPTESQPGDYLLLLSYKGPIRFDAANGLLITPERSLPVDLLARSPDAGALFRIRPEK
ncbi:MAG: hypothetical protein RI988_1463 [Pseudomonadota bacterium]|jgi:hypothetical protein